MSETTRIALIGDSQKTSQGGNGSVYIPRLNYELWQYYGNAPETQMVGYSSFGSGTPLAEWLLRGSTAPAPSATRLQPTQILPGINLRAHSTKNKNHNLNGQLYGQLTMLLQIATRLPEDNQIPMDIDYFDTSANVQAQVFAATHPESGEVGYLARPRADDTTSFFAPATTSGTLNLGLADETFGVKSAVTAPLDFDGNPYISVEIHGSEDDKFTDILGMRFFNPDNPAGVVVQDIAAGGYTTERFLDNHSEAGDTFHALGFHAAILHFGANDASAGTGISSDAFKQDTEQLIDRIRDWTETPDFPIILMGDPYLLGMSDTQESHFDRYPGVQLQIAQEDPNVMVVNTRRLAHDIGWAPGGTPESFLRDDVHYNGFGARELAKLELAALINAAPGDLDLDGDVTFADLSALAQNIDTSPGSGAWRLGDFNADGQVSGDDLALLGLNYGTELLPDGTRTPPDLEAFIEAALGLGLDPTVIPEPAMFTVTFLLAATLLPTYRRPPHATNL